MTATKAKYNSLGNSPQKIKSYEKKSGALGCLNRGDQGRSFNLSSMERTR